jgi:SAM-dependent methyltransferase
MGNDFFSKQSDFYARYRPVYPNHLYDFISAQVKDKNLVWDVATGNGQAAIRLSDLFKEVYATDLSENQLKNAAARPNITYRQEIAESCSLPDVSADLITVATAVHWFDKEKFFREADRVLKPGGVLFVWSYGGCPVNEAIDKVMDHFNFEFLFNYWHAGAKENWDDRYQSLQMPYPLIETPQFVAKANYTMEETMNYMFSWSGVQEYIRQTGLNPLETIEQPLTEAWGDPALKREINWYLHGKCCRKPD